jgi:hypothetical protein
MNRVARSAWNAVMFAVLAMGAQTLTASPLRGSINDPNPGANPDPYYCTYMHPGTYYCDYGSADCRVCTVGVTYVWCNQVLCESTEPF